MKKNYAVVTGGSSGIGLAIARELAARGYSLLLVSNQEELLREAVATIHTHYPVQCRALCMDLTEPASAQQIFDYCQTNQLETEVLVNNAGILVFSEVVSVSITKLSAILQLHMNTPVMLCRLFGEQMRSQNKGHILNVSSISSVMPFPGISLYGPTKTFMRYFTRALRHEMKIYGVNVTCLIPGATATALYDPNKVNLKLARQTGVMQSPEYVAGQAIKALLNRQAECIPGWLNKLTVWFVPLIPSWFIYQLHKRTKLISKGTDALG